MDKHRSGYIKCRRVNQKNSETNAKRIYEDVKCDICHDPAAIVIETYRNIDTKEATEKKMKRYEMNKRMYLCSKHIEEMIKLLKIFENS